MWEGGYGGWGQRSKKILLHSPVSIRHSSSPPLIAETLRISSIKSLMNEPSSLNSAGQWTEDSAVKFSYRTVLPTPQAGRSERDVFTLTGST